MKRLSYAAGLAACTILALVAGGAISGCHSGSDDQSADASPTPAAPGAPIKPEGRAVAPMSMGATAGGPGAPAPSDKVQTTKPVMPAGAPP